MSLLCMHSDDGLRVDIFLIGLSLLIVENAEPDPKVTPKAMDVPQSFILTCAINDGRRFRRFDFLLMDPWMDILDDTSQGNTF